jgi:hypothetical protein
MSPHGKKINYEFFFLSCACCKISNKEALNNQEASQASVQSNYGGAIQAKMQKN